MDHVKLMIELMNHEWAMTHDSFEGIIGALDGKLTSDDYKIFHAVAEEEAKANMSLLGKRDEGTLYSYSDGDTGYLFINGPLIPRATAFSNSSGLVSIGALTEEFNAFDSDDTIKNIALVIDSPGGNVKGISDFASVVAGCGKKTYAYVWGMAASAAYWIASACDMIVSADTGIVGSIGTVMTAFKEDPKSREVTIVSSQSPNKVLSVDSKEGIAARQKLVDDLAQVFIDAVAKNRRVSSETVVEKFGKGGVKVAAGAKEAGMIDEILSMNDFVSMIKSGVSSTVIDIQAGVPESENNQLPANAGLNHEEKTMPTLKEIMAENSAIAQEVEAISADARKAGFEEAKAESEARIKVASAYLSSDKYPDTIKGLASKVISGEVSKDVLTAAVSAVDALLETQNSESARARSEEDGDIESNNQVVVSEDGTIDNEAQYQAELAAYNKSMEA